MPAYEHTLVDADMRSGYVRHSSCIRFKYGRKTWLTLAYSDAEIFFKPYLKNFVRIRDIPHAKNIPYQPLLIKPTFSVLTHAEKQFFSKLVFQWLYADIRWHEGVPYS